eukprot:4278033-Prymnesium_polylepis.1
MGRKAGVGRRRLGVNGHKGLGSSSVCRSAHRLSVLLRQQSLEHVAPRPRQDLERRRRVMVLEHGAVVVPQRERRARRD